MELILEKNICEKKVKGIGIKRKAEHPRLVTADSRAGSQKRSEKQTQELSDAIGHNVRIATLSAQTAFWRIGVAEAFQNQTTQALSLAQTRYKLGLSSIVELSQAQLQSTQATVEAVNARFDQLLTLRSLDYARGQLAP